MGCESIAPSPGPEETVMGFVQAMNDADINTALDYLEPTLAEEIKALISLTGELMEIDLESLVDILPMLGDFVKASGQEIEQIEMEVTNTQIDGDYAQVTCVEKQSGEEGKFDLEKIEGVWYITLDLGDFE